MPMSMYMSMSMSMSMYMYMYMYVYLYVHAHVRVRVYVCMCICVCILACTFGRLTGLSAMWTARRISSSPDASLGRGRVLAGDCLSPFSGLPLCGLLCSVTHAAAIFLYDDVGLSSYKPLEPREGEPRQPNEVNKACQGLSVAIGPCESLLVWVGPPSVGSSGLYDPRYVFLGDYVDRGDSSQDSL